MPRYRLLVDELQRIRRHYVVEADDAEAAHELAERGEAIEEFDDGRYEVAERFVVPNTLIELPQHTYEIEQYEVHTMKYRVAACSEAEAIDRLLDGEGEPMDGTLEYIEVAEDLGLDADDHVELCSQLRTLGISLKAGVVPSIRSIRLVDELKDDMGAISEPAEKETPSQEQSGPALRASQTTYRVRYEIDIDAESPLAAARQAYVYMVSPESYRPVLEVALHRSTSDVDFSAADVFDLHELGCRDDMAQQLERVADIIESTYPHDAEGRRIEGDSPISGADVVERLAALEQPMRDVLARRAPAE